MPERDDHRLHLGIADKIGREEYGPALARQAFAKDLWDRYLAPPRPPRPATRIQGARQWWREHVVAAVRVLVHGPDDEEW